MQIASQRIQDVIKLATTVKQKIALDTNCVQYYISRPPVQPWADCLDPIFRAGLAGQVDLYVSNVVVSELLAQVYFANRNKAGYDSELDLLAILNRHFQILDINNDIARAAGRLRGTFLPGDKITLETPDALIGATSIANGHTLFVTNDEQLSAALPSSNCIYLRDVALEWLDSQFPATCLISTKRVIPAGKGTGLAAHASLESNELGSLRPDPTVTWEQLLADALTVAATLNEPCMFFVLCRTDARRSMTREVLFWHAGLIQPRIPRLIIKRLKEHIGHSHGTDTTIENNNIHIFFCSSHMREQVRQLQPSFASKSDNRRASDAWNNYLTPLWTFRDALQLPQCTWLLCEDNWGHYLNSEKTDLFLKQAKSVLGWKND